MKTVCLYFQVHQPWRLKKYRFFNMGKDHNYLDDLSNRSILQKVARQCYLPMNAMLLKLIQENKGKFRCSFSITGIAIEQFKAETRSEAMRAARDNARALAEAIDQKAGRCFWIADYSSPVRTTFAVANMKARGVMEESASFDAMVEEEGLEFQTINLQHRVQAKFVLE